MDGDTLDRLDDDLTSETIRDDGTTDDTSGVPLSSGAGAGAGHGADGAPEIDVPGGAGEGA